MLIHLEGLEGPAKGMYFNLTPGVKIGRGDVKIHLDDPKVSSLHAQVDIGDKGELFLVDMGSSNGLRINGKRVSGFELTPGVRFQLGSSLFVVKKGHIESSISMTGSTQSGEGNNPFSVLKEEVPNLEAQNRNPIFGFGAFKPPVVVRFLEGIQAEEMLTLGYGPRHFGSGSLDIELFEGSAPSDAFILAPTDVGGVQFSTKNETQVLLNDQRRSSEVLVRGDRIRIGDTLIEIDFYEV